MLRSLPDAELFESGFRPLFPLLRDADPFVVALDPTSRHEGLDGFGQRLRVRASDTEPFG